MISKVIAILLFIVLCPIFISVSIISLLSNGSPILFKQKRVGKMGRVFIMYKFRSMKKNTPSEIPTHLLKNPKQHNTFIGSFIRKYSIDELPQLLNIMKGDMKFIGARPSLLNQHDLNQLRIKLGTINSLPGITGWAQVNGRDNNTIIQKAEMELFYEENKSLYLDLKILVLTVKSMLLPKGVYPD